MNQYIRVSKKGLTTQMRVEGSIQTGIEKRDINTDECWEQYKRVLKKGIDTDECWDQYKRVLEKRFNINECWRPIHTSIGKKDINTDEC